MSFRVISCLVYRKIAFENEVQALLDVPESSLNNLKKSLVKEISKKDTLVNSLGYLQAEKNEI